MCQSAEARGAELLVDPPPLKPYESHLNKGLPLIMHPAHGPLLALSHVGLQIQQHTPGPPS